MIKKNKKTARILMALLMVVNLFAVVLNTTSSVFAAGVVTWNNGGPATWHDPDNMLTGPASKGGITVDYTGGRANMISGLYDYYDTSTGKTTKHIRFTDGTGALKFTSSSSNAFITKIVIKFDKYDSPAGLSDIDVNHGKWTDEDVIGSDGKHTLTLTGPAARSVTLRNHYNAYYYDLENVTSIQFYLTDNLYTNIDGFTVNALEDGGVKIVCGDAVYNVVGQTFLVRIDGKIAYFSQQDSDNTQYVLIEDPQVPFTFETFEDNGTMTVNNSDDFKLILGMPRFNNIIVGSHITLDSGFNISRNVRINLTAHDLSCDASATDKTIKVTGGNSTIVSTSGNWNDTVHGDVNGFDKIEVTGGALNIQAGRYDLPQGITGNVNVTGGFYKLYEGFNADTVRSMVGGYNAVFLRGEWVEVLPHVHAYYKHFTELEDGSLSYIYRCNGCDHTISSWTLTGEEVDTLIELNGGELTPVWQWDRYNPGTAKLQLKISRETYNAAIAAPYNMNESALRVLRDSGFVCSPEFPDGRETVQTNYESYDYSGSNVAVSCGKGLTNDHYEWGACVGNNDNMYYERKPMNVTAKNGRTLYQVIFHIGAYESDAAQATVSSGNIAVLDGGRTLVVSNIYSDSVTLHSNGDNWFQVASVEVVYRGADSFQDATVISTDRQEGHCDGRTASYTYRGQTYSNTFENAAVLSHNFQYDFTWELLEERTVHYTDVRTGWWRDYTINHPELRGVHRSCPDCGLEEDATGFQTDYEDMETESPTYTKDGAIRFPTTAWFSDGSSYSEPYVFVMPKFELTHYPAVPATCEEMGHTEFWYDSQTEQLYSDAEGTQFVTQTNIPEEAMRLEALGHHYVPESGITWNWTLDEVTYFFGNNNQSAKGLIPHATASFVCDRCGKTVEPEAWCEYVSGSFPSFENDGHVIYYAYTHLNNYGYEGTVYDYNKEFTLPKFEREYTKVEAKEPTLTEEGNSEYYICNDGKYYVKDVNVYTEIAEGSWIIPPLGMETVNFGSYRTNYDGRTVTVHGDYAGGGSLTITNVNGSETDKMTISAKSGYKIDKVIYHISWNEERAHNAKIDHGWLSVSEDGRTITVTNVDSKTITLYTNFDEEDAYYADYEDPDAPPPETYFEVSSADVYCVLTHETTYTRVPAKNPTITEAGNTEYYIGSDGKYYVKDGDNYTETTLEAVTIAKIVLVHHNAVKATCTENGNIEYWYDETNNKYFSDAEGENEITQSDTIAPATGHAYAQPIWNWKEITKIKADSSFWQTNADKISLGTSGIAAPSSNANNTAWTGSYVYYGQYDGTPMKYRVLAPGTTDFGGSTMLLDNDSTLFSYPWNTLSSDMNGGAFLTKAGVFSEAERTAIASSSKAAGATYESELGRGTYLGAGLNNEKIFVLEAAEITNPAYGYSNGSTRIKDVKVSPYGYWVRSPYIYSSYGGFVYRYDGGLANGGPEVATSSVLDVSPAFNVNLNSVLFSTKVGENTYKLTLKDGNTVISPVMATRTGNTVTVSYNVTDRNAGDGITANRICVLITDKAYNADGARILYYAPFADEYSAKGVATFTIPEGLGDFVKLYLVAESVNGDYQSNYASEPAEIIVSNVYSNGDTVNVSEIKIGDILCAGTVINCDMQCPANGWNWFVYSDLHPYNPINGGGLTGLSINGSAAKTYVVPNDFKVLSVYNHEIKVEENTSVPTADNNAEGGANWAAEAVFNCVYDDDEQTLKANVTTEVFEPTYTEDGRIVYTARVTFNGQEYSDVKVVKTDDKLVLTYEKVEATAATYTSEGNTEYYIGSDGKYYVKNDNNYTETTLEAVTITRLVLVHHNAVSASCTEDGVAEYWQDEVNNKYFSDANGEHEISLTETLVNAPGHSFGEWVVTKEAQVGVKGEETRTCSVCGETETREIAALPYVPVVNEDGDKVYTVTVTEAAKDLTELFAQAKSEEGTVEVKSNDFAIVFDNDAVSSIGNSNVSLSVKVFTENLSENAELVLEVSLEGATFEVGTATVTIPFEKVVPEGKVAKVYYIDDNGNKTDMNATFENGKLTFITNHFSTYAVMFEDAEPSWDVTFNQSGENVDISISTSNIPETAKIYVASYYLGRLKEVSLVPLKDNTAYKQVSGENIDTIKVFCWGDNLMPLFPKEGYNFK